MSSNKLLSSIGWWKTLGFDFLAGAFRQDAVLDSAVIVSALRDLRDQNDKPGRHVVDKALGYDKGEAFRRLDASLTSLSREMVGHVMGDGLFMGLSTANKMSKCRVNGVDVADVKLRSLDSAGAFLSTFARGDCWISFISGRKTQGLYADCYLKGCYGAKADLSDMIAVVTKEYRRQQLFLAGSKWDESLFFAPQTACYAGRLVGNVKPEERQAQGLVGTGAAHKSASPSV